jgi:CoA-transferase family III
MTRAELVSACLPDLASEQAHLAWLLGGAREQVPGCPEQAGAMGGGQAASPHVATCAVLDFARSGLMHLTGPPGGVPLAPGAPVMARVALVAEAIGALTADRGEPVRLDIAHLLAGRAALQGWQRRGRVSANGTCRLLRAADGWFAVNLARPEDLRSVPAVVGHELHADAWDELARHAARCGAAEMAAAAQLVGIPAAVLGAETPVPLRLRRLGPPGQAPKLALDLSAMWAGPLCARILHQAGWHVLKIEDSRRPDGARSGPAAFYRSLHDGIPALRLDFGTTSGRAELGRLARLAGVVVESTRPRALRRLGLVVEDWLAAAPGRVWVSVTGYGRDDPLQRVAFGDDAAVAGGLVARAADGTPVFCGDAIADPVTGMTAGLAALAATADGGGWLADVAMAGVCADLARPSAGPLHQHVIRPDADGWTVRHGDSVAAVRAW